MMIYVIDIKVKNKFFCKIKASLLKYYLIENLY